MMNFQEYKDHLQQEGHEMFDLCKKQLENAREAFLKHDNDLAEEVVRTESRVNALDLKIDGDCEGFIALHTPVAGDLRNSLRASRRGSPAPGREYQVCSH